jgi:hypothetical protein
MARMQRHGGLAYEINVDQAEYRFHVTAICRVQLIF